MFTHRDHFSSIPEYFNRKKKKKRFILIASLIPARGQLNSEFFVKVSFWGYPLKSIRMWKPSSLSKNHPALEKEWDSLQELQSEVIMHLTAQSWQMMLSCPSKTDWSSQLHAFGGGEQNTYINLSNSVFHTMQTVKVFMHSAAKV